jgi:hypothetical protein
VGTLLGASLSSPASGPLWLSNEDACRIACCGAPGCGGYAFALTDLRYGSDAGCFLYANVTATAASSFVSSGLLAPPTPSPAPSPCAASIFRALPRTDLVGSLAGPASGAAELLASEAACRQACCDAPACDGYAYDAGAALFQPNAPCYLFVNVTQLIPNNGYASGVRESVL